MTATPLNQQASTHPLHAYRLRDVALQGWHERIAGRWHYNDLAADEQWAHGWISFDSLCWDEDRQLLFCGLNSIDGDILYRFNPVDQSFLSCNARRWADAFDSKIHRCLLKNPHDGCLYFGTSLLHDADQQHRAAGGKLVRYDPDADRFEMLGIPEPHLYLQSIAADWHRGLIYAFTYPAELLVCFDLRTRRSRRLAYVGNATMFAQPHNAVIDARGRLWGTYAETRAWDELPGTCPIRLFHYDPDSDRFEWYHHGLPRAADVSQLLVDPPSRFAVLPEAATRHPNDYGFCDSMVFDGDRYIYTGTVAGVLARIDTRDGSVQKLARLSVTGRLPALALKDEVLYAAGGTRGQTQLFRWRCGSSAAEEIGCLQDPVTGDGPARVHEMAIDQRGVIYLAENDNHVRSSYLWAFDPSSRLSGCR